MRSQFILIDIIDNKKIASAVTLSQAVYSGEDDPSGNFILFSCSDECRIFTFLFLPNSCAVSVFSVRK